MARLLDPSYQGASFQLGRKEGQRRSLEVYVDRDGDLHDPDFRYFPAAETFVSQTRRDATERRRSSGATSPVGRRPYLDQDNEHPFLSDEEEEELLVRELGSTDFLTLAGHGNGTSASESSAMRSRRNRRDGSFSSYGFGFSGYPSSANTHSISYYSPTSSTLPTSYDSENTLLTTELEGEKERDKGLLKRRRRCEKEATHVGAAKILETCEEIDGMLQKEERQDGGEFEEDLIEQADYVPTCTETLKRHWLSLSLRFRFGIYRSQRRFMGRVNSLF